MGALGFNVERYQDIAGVVEEAVDSGKPCVIDMAIQGGKEVLAEPFRRDALKKAYRLLPKYKHLNVK